MGRGRVCGSSCAALRQLLLQAGMQLKGSGEVGGCLQHEQRTEFRVGRSGCIAGTRCGTSMGVCELVDGMEPKRPAVPWLPGTVVWEYTSQPPHAAIPDVQHLLRGVSASMLLTLPKQRVPFSHLLQASHVAVAGSPQREHLCQAPSQSSTLRCLGCPSGWDTRTLISPCPCAQPTASCS